MASLNDMSAPAKVTVATGGTAGLLGASYFMFRDTMAIWIVLGGVLFVLLLLVLYWLLLKRIDWRKALRLENIIPTGSNTKGLTPQEVADLAAARKAFAEGVEKFRANGKSLVKVPWYVVVGESGGGKSEAIRRSNIPFIPGLTNKLQGVGGTVNMNWWFTRDAVLLDTAGKWMMEDTSGWEAFLQHLKDNRAECPINGLLLMVPAPSLISDNIPGAMGAGGPKMTLTQKAEHIASQFERMQTTLGIRFPVYVIVTKCDLIEGFNDFFGDLKDGHEINQMLGWSNPAPLDEQFQPDLVDEHLKVVRERLLRRRLRLLQNPVNTDDATRVRTEQVDALYTLPDSLTKIGPRLKQFLDTIFVAGTFSERPLFLRGIFFTSSMQEGAPWDVDLATAMGIPAEALPTGKVQGGERAYFLRDLFVEKVFHERGLVTRAADVDSSHRRRRILLLGSGIAATLLLIGLTVFSFYSFNNAIGDARNLWTTVSGGGFDTREWAAVRTGRDAFVPTQQPNKDSNVTILQALDRSKQYAEKRIHVPWIFGRTDIDLKPANASLVQMSVARPLVQAARQQLAKNDKWDDPDAVAQLCQLVRIEGAASPTTQASTPLNADTYAGLFDYVLKENKQAADKYQQHRNTLHDVMKWTFENSDRFGGVKYWTGAGTKEAQESLDAAITRYVDASRRLLADGAALAQFKSLRESLDAFDAAERKLADGYEPGPTTMQQYKEKHALWARNYADLQLAASKIEQAKQDLKIEGWNVVAAFDKQVSEAADRQMAGLQQLKEATETGGSDFMRKNNRLVATTMDDLKKRSKEDADVVHESLAKLQKLYLDPPSVQGQRVPSYQYHLAVCKSVNDMLEPAPEVIAGANPDEVWAKATQRKQALDALGRQIAAQAQAAPAVATAGAAQPPAAVDAWSNLLDSFTRSILPNMAWPLARYEQAAIVFALPTQAKEWESRVSEQAEDPKRQAAEDSVAKRFRHRMKIPMTTAEENFDDKYFPPVVKDVSERREQIAAMLKPEAKDPLLERDKLVIAFGDCQQSLDEYTNNYLEYWGEKVVQEAQVTAQSWDEFAKAVAGANPNAVNRALENLADRMADAAKSIGERGKKLADRVELTRTTVYDTATFKEESRKVLGNWSGISRSPTARSKLLDLKPEEFKNYVVSDATEDCFLAFWASLPRVGLHCLAENADAELKRDLGQLAQLSRFPLALNGSTAVEMQNSDDLTPQQVDQARDLVNRLLATGGAKQDTLGAKSPTGNTKFDEEIARMRPEAIIDERRLTQLRVMQIVLAALPRSGTPLQCKVTAIKGEQDAFSTWEDVNLKQERNNQLSKAFALRNNIADEVGSGLLPGGVLVFEFGKIDQQAARIAARATIGDAKRSDQWALLRLLLDPSTKARPTVAGQQYSKSWECTFTCSPAAGQHAAVTLRLEFAGANNEGLFPSPQVWEWLRVAAPPPAAPR